MNRSLPYALVGAITLAVVPVLAAALAAAPARAEDTSRVVALGGTVTEILYALGAGDRIVAVDTTSLFPPEALKEKPSVGYVRALSAEGILSARPTLVVAIDGAGPPDALKLVEGAGVPVLRIVDEPSPAGILRKVETLGRLAGDPARPKALAADIARRFAELDAARAAIARPVRALFVLSLLNGRVMVGGRNTTADSIIRLAGAQNAGAGIEGFKPMTDEALVAAAPDVIVMMQGGPTPVTAETVFAQPALSRSPAAAKRVLVTMDGLYLLGFGPRTPDAARDLMRAFYPAAGGG